MIYPVCKEQDRLFPILPASPAIFLNAIIPMKSRCG
jgi:hypothetical protein